MSRFLYGVKAVELLLPREIGEIDNKSCSCERHRFIKKEIVARELMEFMSEKFSTLKVS